jgi:hypothetical protein
MRGENYEGLQAIAVGAGSSSNPAAAVVVVGSASFVVIRFAGHGAVEVHSADVVIGRCKSSERGNGGKELFEKHFLEY